MLQFKRIEQEMGKENIQIIKKVEQIIIGEITKKKITEKEEEIQNEIEKGQRKLQNIIDLEKETKEKNEKMVAEVEREIKNLEEISKKIKNFKIIQNDKGAIIWTKIEEIKEIEQEIEKIDKEIAQETDFLSSIKATMEAVSKYFFILLFLSFLFLCTFDYFSVVQTPRIFAFGKRNK